MEAYDKGMFTYWVSDYGHGVDLLESQRQALDDAECSLKVLWAWLENLAINGNIRPFWQTTQSKDTLK